MFEPLSHPALETLASDHLSETDSGAVRGTRLEAPKAGYERPAGGHAVTEELLDEMGRALAERLNAMVDALDKQKRMP